MVERADRDGKKSRAVVLVSGGLDSVVSLAYAIREHEVRLALFCNYGQRALESERNAVLGVVNFYGLPLREVDVTWLRELAPAGICGPDPENTGDLTSLDEVWIPNRNGVLLHVAAAFAESYRCNTVVTGFNREEAVEFPDNSRAFVEAANHSLEFSTRNAVRVKSYTLDKTKREILLAGIELKAPLSVIWSCYRSGPKMCGTCASCRRLRVAVDALPPSRRPVVEFEG